MSETLTLAPIEHARGKILLPGSKSLTNRILLLAAIAEGDTDISNLLISDDTQHMIQALQQLGVRMRTPSCCCLLYTSPSPRDRTRSRMPSSA